MPTTYFRRSIARAVRPPQRVTVSDAAARHRRLNNPGSYVGPWQNDKVPYLVEPMDAMTSRDVSEVTVVAPAQSGKTEILLNVIGHGAKYRAADMLLLQPTRDLANDFGHRRLQIKTLDCSPDLAVEVGSDRSDDKVLTKVFRNGMICTIAWAVAGQLASRPVPIVMIDERDRMPNDINGEGSPKQLARQRTKTFGRNAKILEVSSPSKTDGTGIIASYREGDQRLWFWPCPDCGEYWAAGFDDDRQPTMAHLSVPSGVTPDQAIELARLTCPRCGVLIDESRKTGMNARGVWVPQGMSVDSNGLLSGLPPEGRHRSYWWHGFNNPIVPVGQLAALWLKAEKHYEQTGDEEPLKTFFNADMGVPYKSRRGGYEPIPEGVLLKRAKASAYRLREVPDGVICLTTAVDVQHNRFAVTVKGWGAGLESWLIDRYDVFQLDDQRTVIEPAIHPEHWPALLKVIWAKYPLQSDPQSTLPSVVTAIDTGGLEGVTDNAFQFWYAALRAGVPETSLMLIKGGSNPNARLLPPPTIDADRGRKSNKRGDEPDAKFYVPNVSRIKDMIASRLRREMPGPLYCNFPSDIPAKHLDELTAETKEDGRWVRIRGRANETLDGYVYNICALARHGGNDVSLSWVPAWARPLKRAEAAPTTPAAENLMPPVAPRAARKGLLVKIRGN